MAGFLFLPVGKQAGETCEKPIQYLLPCLTALLFKRLFQALSSQHDHVDAGRSRLGCKHGRSWRVNVVGVAMNVVGKQKKSWIVAGVMGLPVLLLLVYYLASPWVILARFKADAQARRSERMSIYVDFAAVRASIKTQLLARLQEEMPGADAAGKGLAAVGMALANAALEPAVHVLASPQGLIAMMNGENPLPGFDRLGIAVPSPVAPSKAQPFPAAPNADATRNQANPLHPLHQEAAPQTPPAAASPMSDDPKRTWRLRYVGLNRVVIQRQPAQAGEPYLLMQRRGLFGWQVVDVQLGRLW